MVATGGTARGSRLTASRVLELDDDKSDESVDHELGSDEEVQNSLTFPKRSNGAASKVVAGGKARGSKDANDSEASLPVGGWSGSE